MAIKSTDIQKLRAECGVGIMDCKKALEDARGNFKGAKEIIKKSGTMKALKKAERKTSQGLIESYIHANGKIGALVEVNCETDFVARNPIFKDLVHDLAMQIASMNPKDIKDLQNQQFIKDSDLTIKEYLVERISQTGENIQVKKFIRYELGK